MSQSVRAETKSIVISLTATLMLCNFLFVANVVKANDVISSSNSTSTSTTTSTAYKWKLSKQKDGIASYTRDVASSKYKAVRGETTLPVSTARLFAAINDAPACPEWADTCKESYIQQAVSPHEFFIYTLNDLPWPVADRDVVAHVRWSQDAEGAVVMNSTAVNNKVAQEKGVVRIALATAKWRFKALAENSTAASFEIHMDPNGSIPSWLLNRLILNSPFSTFDNLAEQAAKEKYAGATLPF